MAASTLDSTGDGHSVGNNDPRFKFQNCFYVTIAGMLKITLEELEERTGIPQQNGTYPEGMQELMARAGFLNNDIKTYKSTEEFDDDMRGRLVPGEIRKFPFVYVRSPSPDDAHVVAITVEMSSDGELKRKKFQDFQKKSTDATRITKSDDLPPSHDVYRDGCKYIIFGNGMRKDKEKEGYKYVHFP